jgi:predicted peptidase
MSMGGYGTWYMAGKYGNYCRAAMPMSGCSSGGFGAGSYVNIPIYAIVGGQESDYKNCMSKLVNQINNQGGKATLDVVQGASHGTIQRYYKQEKIFDWMLSQ